MKKYGKKMIAPIIIVVCIALYYLFIGSILFASNELSLAVRILGLAVPVALTGVGIFVLRERIKEIRSGEEDDLSKY